MMHTSKWRAPLDARCRQMAGSMSLLTLAEDGGYARATTLLTQLPDEEAMGHGSATRYAV